MPSRIGLEQFASLLFNDSPLALFAIAIKDKSLAAANSRFTTLTGYTESEIQQHSISVVNLFTPKSSFEELTKDVEHRNGFSREIRIRRKNGSIINLNATCSSVVADDIPFLLIQASELNDQRFLEGKLQKSEDRFTKAFHSSPAALVISRLHDGLLLDVNNATLDLFGYRREDILNKTSLQLDVWQFPEERKAIVEQIRTGNAVSNREVHMRTKSGNVLQCIVSVELVELGGAECLLFLLYDVTEKKKMEELLRRSNEELEQRVAERTRELARTNASLLKEVHDRKEAEAALRKSETRYRPLIEQASDAIIHFDANGIILSANSSACSMVGLKAETVLGTNITDYLEQEQLRAQPLRWESFEEVRTVLSERLVVRSDGSRIETEISSKRMPDGSIQAILRDITERKKAEHEQLALLSEVSRTLQELRTAEQSAESARDQLRELANRLQGIREEERKTIAREIHDDLGQILTGLKIDLGWLEHKLRSADPVLQERTSSMTSMVDRAINSVQHISSELRPGLLDDLGLAAAVEWQLGDFSQRSQIAATAERLDDIPGLDEARATALFRIFQEILANIQRHAQARTVTVSLRLENQQVLLDVKDDGVGITDEQITNPGSIGLLSAKERAFAFGGEFRIEGRKGFGTLVQVSVPIQTPEKS